VTCIGFTGTREGMTIHQKRSLEIVMLMIKKTSGQVLSAVQFHHGDCVGADAEAHEIAMKMQMAITIHPPDVPSARAFCTGAHETIAKPYLERNRDIVDCCDILVVCPKTHKEELRSGTWATWRYAKANRTRNVLIRPDGTVV
jgi:hypothetical protein